MESAAVEHSFRSLAAGLSTARDKVMELSSLMLQWHNHAPKFVSLWLDSLLALDEDKKRQGLLYVMNDVVIKTSRGGDAEYLQAFPAVMDEVIDCLVAGGNELLLEELRKMVLLWEDSKNCIFAPQYTATLRGKIMTAITTVMEEKSGASVIQASELTRSLRSIELAHEAMEPVAETCEKLSRYASHRSTSTSSLEPDKVKELRTSLIQYVSKCEQELKDRSAALMRLATELQSQYEVYNRYESRVYSLHPSPV